MLCGREGKRKPGGKWCQPTTGWMTYSYLQADCLYTGISSVTSMGSLYIFALTMAPDAACLTGLCISSGWLVVVCCSKLTLHSDCCESVVVCAVASWHYTVTVVRLLWDCCCVCCSKLTLHSDCCESAVVCAVASWHYTVTVVSLLCVCCSKLTLHSDCCETVVCAVAGWLYTVTVVSLLLCVL